MIRFITILPLLILTSSLFASRVDTVQIYSAAMRKSIPCLVILPEEYSPTAGDLYPVVYLLHGWSGHFASWLSDAPQLREHADLYRMIIICPDGGYGSWYLDSPVAPEVRYETHVATEVVDYIDYYYHTRRDRGGRAIAGLSMGGHGALLLAARHGDRFGAVGSMAGGLDLRPFRVNNWDLQSVLGDPSRQWGFWEENSVINHVAALQAAAPAIIIDCGLDDFFLPVNRDMHRELLRAGVEHEYIERPGEHNAAYWGNAVDFQVLFFHKFFSKG